MTGFIRLPIAELVIDEKCTNAISVDDEVWNLNLDQIERDSGKVLEKRRVCVGDLGPSTYPFTAGTVLYSKLRPYLNKVVLADEHGYATTELVSLRCNSDKVYAPYLAHYLRAPEFLNFANRVVAGAKMPRMVMSEFWRFAVPVPPLPEQRRIAALLDKANALRAKRFESLVQLDLLTHSIFVEMFGDPSAEDGKFQLRPLLTLVEDGFQNGAYFPKEKYSDDGVEMVHMSDAFGGIIERGGLKRVDCDQKVVDKYSLTPDDLIIARRSLTYEGAAKPCMVPEADEALIFESSFIRVRPIKSLVSPLYLFHYLNNKRVRERFVRPYVTQSTISGINQSNLAKIPVAVPPVDLQVEFSAVMGQLEKIRERIVKASKHDDFLFSSLQHRAFCGEF
ncbi:hypothetical protein PS662_02729 [Pseudomonas fluorescens]|uniref:Type I restriction modification DNA specificity domain-containing protein n=1 Tax=Pseudomonas fluorescens TaxID=294 RepID=A0A5E6THV7_PSEFL|nr:restriction endonuclease subunit S [Pseudomonas fluorescens]VVM89055.1 hypothetical protein PS662_02729 [Pseudomonas fluorescens]